MMHVIIGLTAIFEKSLSLLKSLDQGQNWGGNITVVLFHVSCNHSLHGDGCLLAFFIIVLYWRCNNFGSIAFTGHPQVTTRNRNRFSFAAGDNCRQQLCKYTNPCATASHKLQQTACWKHQQLTVFTIWLYVCTLLPALILYTFTILISMFCNNWGTMTGPLAPLHI